MQFPELSTLPSASLTAIHPTSVPLPPAAPSPLTSDRCPLTALSSPPVPNDPDQPFHLPNGQALYYTLGVETLMRQIFRDESTLLFDLRDGGPMETMTFLWVCAHNVPAIPGLPRTPRPWRAMGPALDGSQLPLYLRPFDLTDTVMDWADQHFPAMDLMGFQVLAQTLWNHHHGAEIIIDPGYKESGSIEPEKKNLTSPIPTPSMPSSTSSPAETPPNGKPSSGTSPSAKPSPADTATSCNSDSPASAPPTTTAASAPPPTG